MTHPSRDPGRVWTHLSDDQADGSACVMCGRSSGSPGWSGTVVGRSEGGAAVVACSGSGTKMTGGPGGRLVPVPGAGGSTCLEQSQQVVPDTPGF